MSRLLILSGPVAAGKTSVAREVVHRVPGGMLLLEGDTFWEHFTALQSEGDRHDKFKAILRASSAAAVGYASTGFDVLLDFTIPPWFMETVRKMIGTRTLDLRYLAILPSLETCAQRAARRDVGRIEEYGPYTDLYRDFEVLGPSNVLRSPMGPARLAEEIVLALPTGAYRF